MSRVVAIIPALDPDKGNIERLNIECLAAGLDVLVLLQTTDESQWAYTHPPLGKGGAMKHANRIVPKDRDVLVIDADLTALDRNTIREAADLVRQDYWVRGAFNEAGRIGRVLPRVLDSLGVLYPDDLATGGALISGVQGYPAGLRHLVDEAPDDFGVDLHLALTCAHASPDGLALVPVGPRHHHHHGGAHTARELVQVLGALESAGSAIAWGNDG